MDLVVPKKWRWSQRILPRLVLAIHKKSATEHVGRGPLVSLNLIDHHASIQGSTAGAHIYQRCGIIFNRICELRNPDSVVICSLDPSHILLYYYIDPFVMKRGTGKVTIYKWCPWTDFDIKLLKHLQTIQTCEKEDVATLWWTNIAMENHHF